MNIEIEEIQKAEKEIAKLKDHEICELFVTIHDEMCKREAKKIILRLADEQKQAR